MLLLMCIKVLEFMLVYSMMCSTHDTFLLAVFYLMEFILLAVVMVIVLFVNQSKLAAYKMEVLLEFCVCVV